MDNATTNPPRTASIILILFTEDFIILYNVPYNKTLTSPKIIRTPPIEEI